MRVQILGASAGPNPELQYASTYLLNGEIAIDAGSLGFWATASRQQRVSHVVLTHSHQDHIASLPFFLENVYDCERPTVELHASAETLATLQTHVFNGKVWPDFIRMSPDRPFVRLHEVHKEQPFEIGGLRFLPVEVPHPAPTLAYIVTDARSTIIFGADSGPTQRLWELAAQTPAPRLIFLEAAFPNSLSGLAAVAQHLTPETFGREAKKLPAADKLIAVHLKPRFRDTIIAELRTLGIPNLIIGESEAVYEV